MDAKQIFTILLIGLFTHQDHVTVEGYKILHFPIPLKSHVSVFGRFAEALAKHGHVAHLLLPNHTTPTSDLDQNKVTPIYFPVSSNQSWANSWEASHIAVKLGQLEQAGMFQWAYEGTEIFKYGVLQLNLECEELFNSSHIIAQLAEEQYDLIVLDSLHIAPCTPMLAYKLGLPVVILSTTNNEWFYRLPRPSAIPSIITESTDVMTFTQRFKSFIIDICEHMIQLNTSTYYSEKYVPEKPAVSAVDIDREALFIFAQYDPVLVYPRPMMPNTVDIGDLMARPGKPLDNEHTGILNNTGKDVIIMSIGTVTTHLPCDLIAQFCEAFQNLDRSVTLIWQTSTPYCDSVPSNVIFKSWVPLNDLLAHPKVKLLITHVGFNSYSEAIYHGKPLIAFPLTLDRPRYAGAIQHKGVGIRMNILSFTGKELLDNINTVLRNDSYKQSAERLSVVMRKRHMEPVDARIAFWIEHVLAFGAGHLRTGTFQLSLIEFLMLDVYFAIFSFFALALVLIFLVIYFSINTLMRVLSKPVKYKTQ